MITRIYYDPNSEAGTSPMLEALNEAEASETKEETTEVQRETSEEGAQKTKFPWGDEDRRKERGKISDDDEIELDYEEDKDGAKVTAKRKISDIKATAKWLKENEQLIRSAVGMREQFKANPELSKAFTKFWERAFDGDKYNPEAVGKMLEMLEGKGEQIENKQEQNADDIAEAEKELEQLDPDSPQYKIAKRNLTALKQVREQLKTALDSNKTLQEKLDGFSKFKGDFEETQRRNVEQAGAKEAADLFDRTFSALASKDGGMTFDDAGDAKEFENGVRDAVATLASQDKIKNDADFVKAIQDSAKAVFENISKRNQRIVAEYLKKKGAAPKEETPKVEKKEQKADERSIGEALMDEMSAAGLN